MGELFEFLGQGAGWVIGIGLTLGVASSVSEGGRPLAKQALKTCFNVTDRARVAAAEIGEQLQDLYAEAKMEYETNSR